MERAHEGIVSIEFLIPRLLEVRKEAGQRRVFGGFGVAGGHVEHVRQLILRRRLRASDDRLRDRRGEVAQDFALHRLENSRVLGAAHEGLFLLPSLHNLPCLLHCGPEARDLQLLHVGFDFVAFTRGHGCLTFGMDLHHQLVGSLLVIT